VSLLQRDFKVWDAKQPVFFFSAPPPPRNPGWFYRKHRPPRRPHQAPRPKTPCVRAQKRLRHHPAEVLVCLERGATGPYLPRYIVNTPMGHCEATAATAGRSRPPQIQNLRPLGRPITTRESLGQGLRTCADAAGASAGRWALGGISHSPQHAAHSTHVE
jgi:hypothetical protein